MASWKKVIVSGSSISQLDNDAGYIASVGGGIVSSSAEGDAQGQIKLNGVNVDANALGTGDSPTFVTVTADLTGNADTATKLATPRAFTTTGDVVITSTNFDGSANFSAAATIQAGAVENSMFASTTKTAISGAFTAVSGGLAGRVTTLESSDFTYDLQVSDGGAGNGAINDAETLTIRGTSNEVEVAYDDGNSRFTVGLPNDVVITGNLTVEGTRTELNVANLNVEDQFILINSGSAGADTGIIFGGSDGTAQEGYAIYWDNNDSVFGFSDDIVAHNATSAAVGTKLGAIQTSTVNPDGAPSLQGVGTINIRTNDETIWIYS